MTEDTAIKKVIQNLSYAHVHTEENLIRISGMLKDRGMRQPPEIQEARSVMGRALEAIEDYFGKDNLPEYMQQRMEQRLRYFKQRRGME